MVSLSPGVGAYLGYFRVIGKLLSAARNALTVDGINHMVSWNEFNINVYSYGKQLTEYLVRLMSKLSSR